MSGSRRIGLSGVLRLASACAAPIAVTQADPIAVHRELTRNVLTAGVPSDLANIVLGRAGLGDPFVNDPEAALWTLHTQVGAVTHNPNTGPVSGCPLSGPAACSLRDHGQLRGNGRDDKECGER